MANHIIAYTDPSTTPLAGYPLYKLTALTLLLALSVVTACAKSVPQPSPADGPKGQPLQRFKVLTFNTLHGLEPSGLTVKASESKHAHQARLNLQFQQLSVVQPELMLLQEVNPLPQWSGRARESSFAATEAQGAQTQRRFWRLRRLHGAADGRASLCADHRS